MAKDPIPQGKYRPAVRCGAFVFTAGMTPRKDGVLIMTGQVPADAELSEYRDAVRQAAANALTAAGNCLEEGERIARVASMTVYVNAAAAFTRHSKVADFASEYLNEMLGDAGIAARTAVGVASLPGDAPVEVSIVAAIE